MSITSSSIEALRAALSALQEAVTDKADALDSAVSDAETERDEILEALRSFVAQAKESVAAMQSASAAIRKLADGGEGELVDTDAILDQLDTIDGETDALQAAADDAAAADPDRPATQPGGAQ